MIYARRLTILLLVCGTGLLVTQAGAQTADARLKRALTLEVRSALLGEVLDRLSAATTVRMEAERDLAGERITLYATRAKLEGLQDAVADLFHASWQAFDLGEKTRYRLRGYAPLLQQAEQLRGRRRAQFLARLYDLERAVARNGAAQASDQLKANVRRRRPDLTQAVLDQITPGYVGQAPLLTPLRFGLAPDLLKIGTATQPYARMSSVQRERFAAFYMSQANQAGGDGGPLSPGAPDPAALSWPRARLEYRLLYGDRSAGLILLTRLGTSDSWASAAFSSAAFDLPDYALLYPEAVARPIEADAYRRIDLTVEPGANWDQTLAALARAAGINILTDSYLRPEAFAAAAPALAYRGTALNQVLDQLALRHGSIWWKSGDWYIFRSRQWGDERRVAVPDRALRAIGQSLASDERISSDSIAGLGALTDEQLLTLHLYGAAAGRGVATAADFDYDEVALIRTGLTIFAQLGEGQRDLARADGIPYMLLNPIQQYLFDNLAYDRGLELDPRAQIQWRFHLADRFERRRLATGWAELGVLSFDFDCGANGVRTARLAVRAPAFEKPVRSSP